MGVQESGRKWQVFLLLFHYYKNLFDQIVSDHIFKVDKVTFDKKSLYKESGAIEVFRTEILAAF